MVKKKVKASDHNNYGTTTIVALLIPVIGFFVGAIYLTKESEVDSKLGEHLIACSVFSLIAYGIIWFTYSQFLAPSSYIAPMGY